MSITPFINQIICGDAQTELRQLPAKSFDCVVTSPPYWNLRDYGISGQLGQEASPDDYVARLCAVFDEVQRVLKETGTLWVNLGDTYNGDAPVRTRSAERFASVPPAYRRKMNGMRKKSLALIPARFSLEMVRRGWILRNEIIWHKPNCMPESVRDRFTVDYEKLFFFTKAPRYYFRRQFEPLKDKTSLMRQRQFNRVGAWKRQYGDEFISTINPATAEASRLKALRQGRNKRCVWTIPTRPFRGGHYATYPPELIETPIKAGCQPGGIVLDPFVGSGTTALVAHRLGRRYVGIELNPKYVQLADERLIKERLTEANEAVSQAAA